MVEKLTTLAKRIRPFIAGQVAAQASSGAFMQEGPDIDLVGNVIGRGGDTILLFDSAGAQVAEFAATGAGLAAALAAATSGDIILLPAGNIAISAGITVGAGVTIIGSGGNETSTLQSVGDIGTQLILLSGISSQLELVRVNYTTASSAAERNAIRQTGQGSSVRRSNAYCTNAGSGDTYGHVVFPGSGIGYVSYSAAIADNNGGGKAAAYAALTNSNLRSCNADGLTGNPSIGIQARGAELRQCQMNGQEYGCVVYSSGAQSTLIIDGDAVGGTAGLYIQDATATAKVYALQYDTITNNGTLTYLQGDRRSLSIPATKTTTYAILKDNEVVLCDATGGAFDVDLPAAAGCKGWIVTVKKIDASANAVTIDPDGGETIDDQGTQVISAQYTALQIVCDGTEWWIV